MLTSFTLENFKSFHEPATLPLAPLTMLAGANASGKSNLVEGLHFLSWLAQGTKLSEIHNRLQESHSQIRGSVRQLAFNSANGFVLSCATTYLEWDKYSISLEYEGDKLCIYEENISNNDNRVNAFEFLVVEPDKLGIETYNRRVRIFKVSPHSGILIDGGESALPVLSSITDTEDPSGIDEQIIRNLSLQYQQWISEILFLNPEPKHMRYYSFSSDKKLSESGKNLSAVLRNLCLDPDIKCKILDIAQALPEQHIQDLKFIETPRNEVMVTLTEIMGGKELTFDAGLLSDGTLRVLSIAAAILSVKEGSMIVIEEIDNGIHPSRLEALLRSLFDVAKERELRLLLTTHNPALLDALPEEAVPDIVFCFRHPETGASQLTRLSDLTDYSGLVARGGIGSLMTQGIVDRFVKNPRTPEEKRRQALTWLEEVRAETG